MRLISLLPQAVVLLGVLHNGVSAAGWSFTEGSVSVQGKGAGVGGGLKEKLTPSKPVTSPIKLGPVDTLKVVLSTQEGKSAKRPHQAFLLLQDPATNLDISYPFSVKESGKAKLDLTHKDLPVQFLRGSSPLTASIILGSVGTSEALNSKAFTLNVDLEGSTTVPSSEKPIRYGKRPEIHHIFRADPKSPNIVITLTFLGAVLATLPVLFGAWLYLGGNVNHVSRALSDAPLSHTLFVGSIIGIEGVFFLYYTTWNLFKTLPVLSAIGLVAFLSGSRALTEVQERRLAGQR
ncbi:hypothetical protein B0A52_08801 [Exophiala mesophila]|uniref:Ribophorin II C-terminal domain-containing protein n=1 Tax=Exophiala mesophila TaxID=212818 RepID=A0A438MWY0_EXOME|nr:hypothetical protein B0A52_08801 [Exophiala mesophila]